MTSYSGYRDILERVKEQLGEAIHTSLRKASDHEQANVAWHAINALPAKEWQSVLDYALWGLGVEDALKQDGPSEGRQPEPSPASTSPSTIADIVEGYTDILSPETARKVASRIRVIPFSSPLDMERMREALQELVDAREEFISAKFKGTDKAYRRATLREGSAWEKARAALSGSGKGG